MNSDSSFLGRGWSFPIEFTRGENGATMVEDEEDIVQSLKILLATIKGERVMQFDYGANVEEMVFEPLSVSFAKRMSTQIERAIMFHEPRIKTEDVDFIQNTNNGEVQIIIDYIIIATNSRRNLVYPFYKNEGTDITQ